MKILSLFDGISCARVALERAGIPVEKYYASEVDKYAIQISQKNYPDIIQKGDVTKLSIGDNFDWLPEEVDILNVDLLIGGSPCQDLSIAKKDRKGLNGERSGLFWEYVRILNEVKPKFFILENVASMPKEAKELISKTLGVEPIMINASLVSAQNRKRLFWVGKFSEHGGYEQVEIPQPKDKRILLKDILEEDVDENFTIKNVNLIGTQSNIKKELNFLGGIRNKDWAKDGKNYSRNFGQGDRVYSPEGKSATLSDLGGGRGAKTGLYAVRSNYNNTLNYEKANTLGSNSQCQTAKTGQGLVDFEKQIIRKLTPIECERLQGLPDNYTDGISNSQRYKCLGNAFNVDVVAHILSFLPKNDR
jgi:DNA (cytosine-5)-methyltransferase 3A